jgi:hypothetical protein
MLYKEFSPFLSEETPLIDPVLQQWQLYKTKAEISNYYSGTIFLLLISSFLCMSLDNKVKINPLVQTWACLLDLKYSTIRESKQRNETTQSKAHPLWAYIETPLWKLS